jgi:hypothetical protein
MSKGIKGTAERLEVEMHRVLATVHAMSSIQPQLITEIEQTQKE